MRCVHVTNFASVRLERKQHKPLLSFMHLHIISEGSTVGVEGGGWRVEGGGWRVGGYRGYSPDLSCRHPH